MSFYSIDPSHPHLGAAINIKLYPLAAAEEVGFSEVVEAYVLYGDGIWQRGHKLFKRDGVFCFRIPNFTGARLFLWFYLIDSEGNGVFTSGFEHPVHFGQYANLFDNLDAQQPEVGGLIVIGEDNLEELSEQIAGALRSGTASLWFRLQTELLTGSDLKIQLAGIWNSAQRLPGSYIELVSPDGVGLDELKAILDVLDLVSRKWLKALVLSGAAGSKERVALAEQLAQESGLKVLAGVSPLDYLTYELESVPQALPVTTEGSCLELAVLRAAAGSEGALFWVVQEEADPWHLEYLLATGAGHVFSPAPAEGIINLVAPALIDLDLILPLEQIKAETLISGVGLEEVLAALAEAGYITGVSPLGRKWRARSGVYICEQVDSDELKALITDGRPVLVLTKEGPNIEKEDLPSLVRLHTLPGSLTELLDLVTEWFKTEVEIRGNWQVIPGDEEVKERRRS